MGNSLANNAASSNGKLRSAPFTPQAAEIIRCYLAGMSPRDIMVRTNHDRPYVQHVLQKWRRAQKREAVA